MHRSIVAMCALAGLATSVAAAQQSAPQPYQIFARAREYWRAQQYPPYLSYDVAVTVDEGAAPKTEQYRTNDDLTTGTVTVESVSDWELQHPASGKGVNLGFSLLFIPVPLNKPLPPVDFLGVPLLAPTYSFGMSTFVPVSPPHRETDAQIVAEIRQEFRDPNPRVSQSPSPSASDGLREIAEVSTVTHDYQIELEGIETVAGTSCYHLQLTPLHDRSKYRLRDLWIDRDTYATEKLREAQNFETGPGTAVAWTVTFADIAGAHYVASESADMPMTYGGLVYRHATVAFENVRPLSVAPTPNPYRLTAPLIMQEPSTPQ